MAQELIPRTRALPVPEVLRRIAPAFRQVVIDWIVGDEHQAAVAKKLKQLGVSDPQFLSETQAEEMVFIRVADLPGEDNALVFKMRAGGTTREILIGYASAKHERACRPLLAKLAELLDCSVAESEWD